jgi:peptidoglycan-associated lipoprotein
MSVRLEGNADERGSTEYNLALGQKRAEAVRHAMALLGVPEGSMEAVSYGKEKLRAKCHEEKCWAEDRRVDFAAKKAPDGK